MKKYFPNCTDDMWCLGKAIETARQRVYEADEGDAEDLNEVDAIWNMVWGEITGKDLSGCSSCKDDKDGWSSGSDIAPQKLTQQFESATVLQDSNEHKSFIDRWIEHYAGESNFVTEMVYIGANEAIRQGPLEVRIIKTFHVDDEPTYSLYWKDVDMEQHWLEYLTFTALLSEWEPVWEKGMFESHPKMHEKES